jgi:PilZ domain-containing protein
MAASNHSFARILEFPGERRSSIAANWPVQAERRLKFRYPMELSVRFRYFSGESHFSGTGLAVNLSSGGILVASRHRIVEGALVEMSIEWPCVLHGKVPLQLVAVGRVLRREESGFAASFERHEFRTMRISSSNP